MVDWDTYYRKYESGRGVTFGDSAQAYSFTLNRLNIKNPRLAVLGGFAHTFSVRNFEDFCEERLPETKILALDLNLRPLRAARLYPVKTPVLQADLTTLPFKQASIDLIFLDFTLNCMPTTSIPEVFRSASEILTPNGAILASIIDKSTANWASRLWLRLETGKDNPYNYPTVEEIRGHAMQFNSPFLVEADHPGVFGPPIKIIPFTKKPI